MGTLNLSHLISCNYVIMNNLPTSMWKTFLRLSQPCIARIVARKESRGQNAEGVKSFRAVAQT